ncbi:hypothetical protein CLV62_1442 [Dysgonomonas alginatilytica]|uniref:Uncharacterized protein n=1 Tax=Dysgonomonas alginatilytica TaxID=1605892 RepID=A0A2V3PJW9_9BACT|nr:hypothetical protein CLV62_1442 [Dysgonomonas alginatilytica]
MKRINKIVIVLAILTLGITTDIVVMQPMKDTQKPLIHQSKTLIGDGSSVNH